MTSQNISGSQKLQEGLQAHIATLSTPPRPTTTPISTDTLLTYLSLYMYNVYRMQSVINYDIKTMLILVLVSILNYVPTNLHVNPIIYIN